MSIVLDAPKLINVDTKYYDISGGTYVSASSVSLSTIAGILARTEVTFNFGKTRYSLISSVEYEYSLDGGSTWNPISIGSSNPETAANNNEVQSSNILKSDADPRQIDQWVKSPVYGNNNVDLRCKIVLVDGSVKYSNAISFDIDWLSLERNTINDSFVTNIYYHKFGSEKETIRDDFSTNIDYASWKLSPKNYDFIDIVDDFSTNIENT